MKPDKVKIKEIKTGVVKVLKAPEMREYLYRFYRKRVASFLANLYKAGITSEMKDIHRSRLDVKKLYALFQLFELIDADTFNQKKHIARFNNLYRRSGKIREIQVSLLLLERFDQSSAVLESFRAFMLNQEKLQTVKLMKVIREFREKDIRKTDKVVQLVIGLVNPARMVSQSNRFLAEKSKRVTVLTALADQPENVHNIRKELKSMSTICTLLLSMRQDEFLDRVVTSLNQSEMMIGSWHDNMVLMDYFDKFISTSENIPEALTNRLQEIGSVLKKENTEVLGKLLPEVLDLVNYIRPVKQERNS